MIDHWPLWQPKGLKPQTERREPFFVTSSGRSSSLWRNSLRRCHGIFTPFYNLQYTTRSPQPAVHLRREITWRMGEKIISPFNRQVQLFQREVPTRSSAETKSWRSGDPTHFRFVGKTSSSLQAYTSVQSQCKVSAQYNL